MSEIDWDDLDQKMCPDCGGMVELLYKGEIVPAANWMAYGFACDIGCVC